MSHVKSLIIPRIVCWGKRLHEFQEDFSLSILSIRIKSIKAAIPSKIYFRRMSICACNVFSKPQDHKIIVDLLKCGEWVSVVAAPATWQCNREHCSIRRVYVIHWKLLTPIPLRYSFNQNVNIRYPWPLWPLLWCPETLWENSLNNHILMEYVSLLYGKIRGATVLWPFCL